MFFQMITKDRGFPLWRSIDTDDIKWFYMGMLLNKGLFIIIYINTDLFEKIIV